MKIKETVLRGDGSIEVVDREVGDNYFTFETAHTTEPTQLDRIEAQVAYTAMMTDTLLEG